MRSEEQYLTDIVEAADAIARFLSGVNRQQFLEDELRQSAVIQKIGVIGEAASKITPELRGRYPDVDWPKIDFAAQNNGTAPWRCQNTEEK